MRSLVTKTKDRTVYGDDNLSPKPGYIHACVSGLEKRYGYTKRSRWAESVLLTREEIAELARRFPVVPAPPAEGVNHG